MKRRIFYKGVLLICGIFLLLLPVSRVLRTAYLKSLDEPAFRFARETTIIIAGDSHMETSVNPALIPHIENISCSAENYFYTYFKLKHFIAKNPQISKIVLGFSWHNFPKKYQESYLFGDIPEKIDQYFLLLDSDGQEVIRTTESAYLVPWLRYQVGLPLQIYNDQILYRELLGGRLTRGNYTFYGGYRASQSSNVSQARIREKIQLYYYNRGTPTTASPIMIRYLKKILALCREHRISVVLLNTPVHGDYRRAVPASAVAAFDRIRAGILQSYPEVSYRDFSALPLPTAFYSDGDHVNMMGSEVVTRALVARNGLSPHAR